MKITVDKPLFLLYDKENVLLIGLLLCLLHNSYIKG